MCYAIHLLFRPVVSTSEKMPQIAKLCVFNLPFNSPAIHNNIVKLLCFNFNMFILKICMKV